MRILPLLSFTLVALLGSGCVQHYYSQVDPSQIAPKTEDVNAIAITRYKVPVVITVSAANDMTGQNKSFWDGTPLGWRYLYHYPLKQLVMDCYNNAVYKVFEQPGGEVIDAFEMKITPLKSLLSEDGGEAQYSLSILINFYEPGGKLLYGETFDRVKYGKIGEPNHVPDVVYATIKDVTLDSLSKALKDPKVINAISRFSRQ